MLRFFILVLFISGIFSNITAQSDHLVPDTLNSFLSDTMLIQEVEIISPVSKKPEIGSKTEIMTQMQMENTISGSLTNLISRYTPIFIKSDAGGLATFRIRGTSSSHTSVLIGGLDINSLTLGSSNASNIPIYLFDEIGINYGSASASIGSGSIGGSVRLGFKENWTNGFNGESFGSVGSFGSYSGGSKLFAGNGKIESVTRLFKISKENNFPFLNTGYYDRELHKFHRDTLINSAINNINILQQINYKFSNSNVLKSFFWFSDNQHEAQPTMLANNNKDLAVRLIEDRSFKSWIEYRNTSNDINYTLEGGFVKDKNIDNNNFKNTIGTQRLVSRINLDFRSKEIDYQFDITYKYIIPEVYAYDNDISEQHLDVHGSAFLYLTPKLATTLNLRQQFITHYKAPFTPAIGMEYLLLSKEDFIIKLIANAQRSYRIPTLNDRYWGQDGYQGNENISPEDGKNYEFGIKYTLCNSNTTLRINTNAYYMDVNNWILWIQQTSDWQADNILRVISKGIEFHMDANFHMNKIDLNTGLNFSANSTFSKKSKLETDNLLRKDKQIIYTPKYMANGFISFAYNSMCLSLDGSYTGSRYYNNSADSNLDSYILLNLSASKKIKLNSNTLKISLAINNLLSEHYENQYQYAMPEINYNISLKYNF